MGFQIYDNTGKENRSLTGTAGGDLTGTYPNPTLASSLANNLAVNQTGVTNRSAMAAMTTERTTTSTSYVDVTGASLSFTVASGAFVIVGYSCQIKSSTLGGVAGARVLANSCVCNPTVVPNLSSAADVSVSSNANFYRLAGGMAMFPAAEIGTGAQTFKWQFLSQSTYTAYIDECYLTVMQITV